MALVHVAVGVILDADRNVLITRRGPHAHQGGLWEFPGGKVHEGETPEAALIRELQEELDIDIRASCLAPLTFASHSYEKFHLLMPLYVCRQWRGMLTAKENQNMAWVRASALRPAPARMSPRRSA